MKYYSCFLILMIISLMACQPSLGDNMTNRKANKMKKQFLEKYEQNKRLKLKTQLTYDFFDDKKLLTRISYFDTEGRLIKKKQIRYSKNNIVIDTTTFYNYYENEMLTKTEIKGNFYNTGTNYYFRNNVGILTRIYQDSPQPISYILNTKNTNKNIYELIGIYGNRTKIPDNIDWTKTDKRIQRIDLYGNQLMFINESKGVEFMRLEYEYDKRHQIISKKEYFYDKLTSESIFEYNKSNLLIRERTTSFPFQQKENQIYSPTKKPELTVYEYEYYD